MGIVPANTVEQVVYTVPVDRTALVKFVTFTSTAAVPGVARMGIDPAGGVTARHMYAQEVPASRSLSLLAWFAVLHEGDSLVVTNETAAGLHYTVHGALLAGDPS